MSARSENRVFDDIVIRFTRQIYYQDETAFQLDVLQSPEPLPGGAFKVDIETRLAEFSQVLANSVQEDHFFYRFEFVAARRESERQLNDLGGQIYALLPMAFQEAFPRLIQNVWEKGNGLSLILQARAGDRADRLLCLPWEILFFNETQTFFARSPRVLVIRQLLDAVRRSPIQLQSPLNVVHIIAHNPDALPPDRIDAGLEQIECQSIRRATQPGHYQLVTGFGSVEQLSAALRERDYHIVHFLGHGAIERPEAQGRTDPGPARGYLRFIGANAAVQPVTGEWLEHLLHAAPSVQAVVLNACHGGENVAGSVALELIYNGLPYVVAIQSSIKQDAARYFIEAFYAELQDGQPIEYAVAAGRSAIAAHLPQVIDWCLPVLYTNLGWTQQPLLTRIADRLWHWAGSPRAGRQISLVNAALGALNLVVALLLLLSGQTRVPPEIAARILGMTTLIPPFIAASVYLGQFSISRPNRAGTTHWPFSARLALLIRSWASASVGFCLPGLYVWFLLVLFVSLGFWSILSPLAQTVFLGILFIPGILLSGLNGYAQVTGHVRAWISETQVEMPVLKWGELWMVAGAYLMLWMPWILSRFWPALVTSPWSNLGIGIILGMLGYALRQPRAT